MNKNRESSYSNYNEQYHKDVVMNHDNIQSTMKDTVDIDPNNTPNVFRNSDRKPRDYKEEMIENNNQERQPMVNSFESDKIGQRDANMNHFYKKSDRDSNTFTFNRPNDDNYFGTDSRGNDITNDVREYDNSYKQGESDRIMSEKDLNKKKEPYDSQSNNYLNLGRSVEVHDLPPKRRSYDGRNNESMGNNSMQESTNLTLKSQQHEKNNYLRERNSPTKNLNNSADYDNSLHYKNHRQTNSYSHKTEQFTREYHENSFLKRQGNSL